MGQFALHENILFLHCSADGEGTVGMGGRRQFPGEHLQLIAGRKKKKVEQH